MEIRTITLPGCIARVHIPDIPEEERERRMNRIKKAAAELLLERRNEHEDIKEYSVKDNTGGCVDSGYTERMFA